MAKAKIKFEEGSRLNVLSQIKQENFRELADYRLSQRSILQQQGMEYGKKDIDYVLNELHDMNDPADETYFFGEPEDQLRHLSEEIVEELESYRTFLELLEPDDRERTRKSTNRLEGLYMQNMDNFEYIYRGFAKLPEQSNLEYTEPFENLEKRPSF